MVVYYNQLCELDPFLITCCCFFSLVEEKAVVRTTLTQAIPLAKGEGLQPWPMGQFGHSPHPRKLLEVHPSLQRSKLRCRSYTVDTKVAAATASASVPASSDICSPPTDEDGDSHIWAWPEVCNNNNNNNDILDENLLPTEKKEHFRESREDKALPADMFPMETLPGLPENLPVSRVPQPGMENEECKIKK